MQSHQNMSGLLRGPLNFHRFLLYLRMASGIIEKLNAFTTMQNCQAQESADIDQYTISSCEENNCRSFMAYLGIDTTISEDCNLPNLSDDALSRLWSLDEIGITLVSDIILHSYRSSNDRMAERQKYKGGVARESIS